MTRLAFSAAFLALIVLSLAFAACGDDKDKDPQSTDPVTSQESFDDSNITTTKGLTVSAVNAGFGGGAVRIEDSGFSGAIGVSGAPYDASLGKLANPAAGSFGGDQSSSNSVAAQQGQAGGLTVTGYGTAKAPADSAILELYFYADGYSSSGPPTLNDDDRVTEDTLKPVADTLVALGVAEADIEFVGQGYYDKFSSSGSIRAIVRDVDDADSIATAVTEAAADLPGRITHNNTSVTYTLQDCGNLETAATRTAAEDAADNAQRLADALDVGVGAIVAASDYSYPWYYPYFGAETCGSSYYGPIVYYADSGGTLADQPKEVEVFANINVTYAIQ